MTVPPRLRWMAGAAAMRRWWWLREGATCATARLVPLEDANGSAAFVIELPSASGGYAPAGVQAVEVAHGRITAIHSFLEPSLVTLFGLPA